MGLLDYADLARKKLAGLLGDMPLVQMAQGRAEAPTMGGLFGALKSMPVFSPDAGQSAYEAALNIGPMGLGKIVYHGSPHKFDKFDASKIGTGEGAQAYGHGVYLADSPGVAGGYAEKLSDAQGNIPLIQARQDAINTFKKRIASGGDAALYGPQIKQLEWEIADLSKNLNTGQLYKADLPDEWIPKMLDWDKPIKELPQSVQQNIYNKLTDIGIDKGVVNHIINNKTGQELMNELAGRMSVRNPSPLPGSAQASQLLREAGIPGIRYLDGGSRGKGQGSYNYVVFPGLEDQVKILERNGIPLSGLLGGQ